MNILRYKLLSKCQFLLLLAKDILGIDRNSKIEVSIVNNG